MKISGKIGKKIQFVTPLVLATLSLQVHAGDYSALRSIIAHTPYIINIEKTIASPNAPNGLSPMQVRHAYGFDLITNQGAGQTIAIVDAYDDPNIEADLGVFSSTFNLPACTTANGCFTKVFASGTQPPGSTGWGTEISLDVEWAHAIAPQAKIMLVEAASNSLADLFKAIDVSVQRGASVVSMSWGGGESSSEISSDSAFNVPGVTFTASSGDGGHGNIYPSVSPYVISVGGTTLHVDANGNYQSETAWRGSGGGLSTYEMEPSYQTNFPIPNNPSNKRGAPDISMVADPATGVSVYDTYGHGGWLVIGGTSASAPMVGAMAAVANSAAAKNLPGINATLYSLAKSNYAGLFNDIQSGTNGSCGTLCTAQLGYDYVTGLGTPKANTLIPAIAGNSGGGTGTELKNGVPITNLSGAQGNQNYWYVNVPNGVSTLNLSISGGTGDADLYVQFGSKPTLTTYQCRPYEHGNNETCTFTPPQAGQYWVMLNGYANYSGVTLSANY